MFIQEWVLASIAMILNLSYKLGTSNLYITSSPRMHPTIRETDPVPEDLGLDEEPQELRDLTKASCFNSQSTQLLHPAP